MEAQGTLGEALARSWFMQSLEGYFIDSAERAQDIVPLHFWAMYQLNNRIFNNRTFELRTGGLQAAPKGAL